MEIRGNQGWEWDTAASALRRKEEQLLERIMVRNRTRTLVATAISEGRVRLALQPIVYAHTTTSTAFYEGLVRIEMPDGTLVSPGDILPKIAGLPEAAALDEVVLQLALTALARDPGLRLSVNVAPATISSPSWLDVLERAHAEAPDVCYRLIVEITETASLLHKRDVPAFLKAVRATGANIALDDFGAGHTSFRYFRELRFDMVKIDGGFCAGIATDPDAACLVTALVGIAKHFEMVCVAEHISDPRDASKVAELGVDCLQGHLYGTPELCDVSLTSSGAASTRKAAANPRN
ncbi:MAG: EAL domain-containing protein [Pseudomonadota bacterium]